MNRLPCLPIAMALMMISGCVTFEEEPTASDGPATTEPTRSTAMPRPTVAPGDMTARESTALTVGPCNREAPPASFCAVKTHWVEGALSLPALPATLESFNGNLEVKGGTNGVWNLTVQLRAKGETEAGARANLENIEFTWSHESGGEHAVSAKARRKVSTQNQEGASMSLTVPASVLLQVHAKTTNGGASARGIQGDDVVLSTTNGAVSAQDLEAKGIELETTNGGASITTVQADSIHATTSNGNIKVTASAKTYELQATNGALDLRLKPSGSGKVSASTTNGPISLALAEDSSRGYDLRATTTNGLVSVTLKDGQTSGSNTAKTFKTSGFSGRSIQSQVTVGSTNAVINVAPL